MFGKCCFLSFSNKIKQLRMSQFDWGQMFFDFDNLDVGKRQELLTILNGQGDGRPTELPWSDEKLYSLEECCQVDELSCGQEIDMPNKFPAEHHASVPMYQVPAGYPLPHQHLHHPQQALTTIYSYHPGMVMAPGMTPVYMPVFTAASMVPQPVITATGMMMAPPSIHPGMMPPTRVYPAEVMSPPMVTPGTMMGVPPACGVAGLPVQLTGAVNDFDVVGRPLVMSSQVQRQHHTSPIRHPGAELPRRSPGVLTTAAVDDDLTTSSVVKNIQDTFVVVEEGVENLTIATDASFGGVNVNANQNRCNSSGYDADESEKFDRAIDFPNVGTDNIVPESSVDGLTTSPHVKTVSPDPTDIKCEADTLPSLKENGHWPAITVSTTQSGADSTSSKPKATSWASLLRDTASATNAIVINSVSSDQPTKAMENRTLPIANRTTTFDALPKDVQSEEQMRRQLLEAIKSHKLSHRSVHIQPRGLTNRGNWCYVNASLQALLACPPFYHLVRLLPTSAGHPSTDSTNMPVIRSMIEFVNEFSVVPVKALDKQAVNSKGTMKSDIKCGPPFEPVNVYKMLQLIDYEAFKHGQQEDAEEFLSCILNRLHDEMVAVVKPQEKGCEVRNSAAPQDVPNGGNDVDAHQGKSIDDDETRWEQVRSRNRTVFSCTADCESSPISAIFRGQICSILHQAGQKESATLQPFFTLQLDVQNENVKSVQDALEQLVSKESLQGYTCTKSKVEVDATRRILIEELPPVLVLHLKWFVYDKNGGMQKSIKQVDFDVDLELNKDLLSTHAKAKGSNRKYKLFAVVNHIGMRAIGGHYTVDVFHPGYNCWVRCDDNNINSIPLVSVTKFSTPKVPYLIFYRRIEPS